MEIAITIVLLSAIAAAVLVAWKADNKKKDPEKKPKPKPVEEVKEEQEKPKEEPEIKEKPEEPKRRQAAYLRLIRDKEKVGWIYFGKLEVRDTRTHELLEKPFSVGSGLKGNIVFRTGASSKRGSNEPLPEGYYNVGKEEWAGGKDNYSVDWHGRVGLGYGK